MKRLVLDVLERARRFGPPPIKEGYTWTAYMRWLSYANAGMLTHGNVACWRYAVENAPPSLPIIEIGSFCGLSTNFLCHFAGLVSPARKVFSCDRWIFEGESGQRDQPIAGGTDITVAEYRDFVRTSFLRNCRFFSRRCLPHSLEMYSTEFFSAWRSQVDVQDVFENRVTLGGPIGFAFVDGDHSLEGTRKDFQECDEFLAPGGFLLFDDSRDLSDWQPNVVAREALRDGRYELVARNPNYLLRKK